jgi:alpha-tubulin suppressor-like RCC1 family protein
MIHNTSTINSNSNTLQHFFYTPTKIFSSFNSNQNNNPFVNDPPSIVACGHSHILVVTQNTGSVYTWGAGMFFMVLIVLKII